MTRHELGDTGLSISRVGLGTWAMGGPGAMGWGAQDDDDSVAALHRAVERGVNWVDTAPVYGHGHSELVVGRALRELPEADRPLVFTKCGLVWNERGDEDTSLWPESIRRECEDSLRRLGVDHIDLYQIHDPDPSGPPVEESWATMLALVREGKARAVGVSNFDTELLARCAAVGPVGSLQPPLSLVNRSALADVIPWCAERGTGVIVYGPMQFGLLTGAFTEARAAALPEDDWRSRAAEFTEPKLSRNLALQDALRPVAARHEVGPAVVPVAWAAAQTGVTGVIVGARTPDQVDGWAPALDLDLGRDDLAELHAAVHRTGAGQGPVAEESTR
ncbi:aldo/keto reductase [Pseudonocardia acaciae]|uniref:aldo/keto reductase n=1 Tax=Pseudonocardia acaciae TaxID=551276 RepID=UPI00048E1858|nr:aldo/keto reductase [Pseudonocardia acaciae]